MILVSIKLSIYDHSFVHKLQEYNSRKALKQGMKNPYILQKLKNMTQVIPQNLYTVMLYYETYYSVMLIYYLLTDLQQFHSIHAQHGTTCTLKINKTKCDLLDVFKIKHF